MQQAIRWIIIGMAVALVFAAILSPKYFTRLVTFSDYSYILFLSLIFGTAIIGSIAQYIIDSTYMRRENTGLQGGEKVIAQAFASSSKGELLQMLNSQVYRGKLAVTNLGLSFISLKQFEKNDTVTWFAPYDKISKVYKSRGGLFKITELLNILTKDGEEKRFVLDYSENLDKIMTYLSKKIK